MLPMMNNYPFLIDDDGPQEQFLGSHECQTGINGEAIASDILEQLANWQLEPRFL